MAFAPQLPGSPEPTPPTQVQPPPPEQELLRLCNLLGIGVVRVDAGGRAWSLNDAGGTLLATVGGASGEPAPDPLPELLRAAAIEGPRLDETVTHLPESRHVAITASHNGNGGLVLLRDNTDERLLHERLLQSEKMASVGQLVSGVAHELNNPLTGVMGFSQLLLARELDETVRSQIQTIYDEAERAAKIVQNLLSFARRRRPSKEMADVNALVQRVLELRSYDFAVRNISLDMTLDTRMSRVWADPDQIQQVLFNVIKNAEQAMIDRNAGGRLTVVTRGSPTGVRVSVADDGPGIPPEIQRRIFDPFFTTKDAGEGTGLGLTICYSIIDEHGGRIWTENKPEGGAVFHIELPVGVPEETEAGGDAGQTPEGPSPAVSARRVLVVDDEVSIRQLLYEILSLDKHSVALASSGVEAADLVERESFDVIITDMKMPGMDGASFYRQVRQRDPAQARRIIFITGDTVSPDTRAFLQRVSNPVLSKPFHIGPLRDAIESVLPA
jgi:signal transduction histidine kinase